MCVSIIVSIEYSNAQQFFQLKFYVVLWLVLELPVYLTNERILKPNFNE